MIFHREDTIRQTLDKNMTSGHIVIAGGRGLIGSALYAACVSAGYRVFVLSRSRSDLSHVIQWNPSVKTIEKNVFEGCRAVINLCGASLADHRWTSDYKRLLHTSRTEPATFIAQLVSEVNTPPECYIGISGIGIYGDQGELSITENRGTESATGFIPDLVRAWEEAHRTIPVHRKIILRTGVVLSQEGGFVKKLDLPRRFWLYPYFCSGKQILSWIQTEDLTTIMLRCVAEDTMQGIYHATSPGSVTVRDLSRAFRTSSGTPGFLIRVPALFLKAGLGELGGMLCESADVQPHRLLKEGFVFKYPEIAQALKAALRTT